MDKAKRHILVRELKELYKVEPTSLLIRALAEAKEKYESLRIERIDTSVTAMAKALR